MLFFVRMGNFFTVNVLTFLKDIQRGYTGFKKYILLDSIRGYCRSYMLQTLMK